MGKLKKKLGCASLFQCFGSSKKRNNTTDTIAQDVQRRPQDDKKKQNINAAKKRVTIKEDVNRHSPKSPIELDNQSFTSGRSSIYFDASEGGSEAWHSVNGDDSFDDDSFISFQLDGQYFFNAKDDPNITKEAFEGIHMYPPLPTTEPDHIPRSPISVSNMQSLLHTYQHSEDDIVAQKSNEEADIAAGVAGVALEHQAQRLMMPGDSNKLDESTDLLLKELKVQNVREKGFPGELTEEELEAVKLFQKELQTRDPIYNQIVRHLSSVEKEAFALCRFLRARKFDVDKVFELLYEAKDHFAKAKEHDFYPDLEKSLGFSRPVFLSQYPAVFCGNAKNGCPVMYLKCGSIQPEGIKALVSFDEVDRFFWNDITYSFTGVLKEGRHINPNFARTENITIYDLKGVSRSQISSETFDMIKVGNQVMTSFPETLHCLLIINAPSWFGMVWSIIKKLIDARTASKIEVFTSTKAGNKRMNELIDSSQIASDYGGSGPSLAEAAAGGSSDEESNGSRNKMVVLNQLLPLTKKRPVNGYDFEIEDSKQMTLTVYTRCKTGATATVIRNDNASLVSEISITGEKEDTPYSRTICALQGPGSFTLELEAKDQPGVFLLLGTVVA